MRKALFVAVSALVLGLAPMSHAASSHFMVSGSLSQTGYEPQWGPTGAGFSPWSKSATADDLVADGLSVSDGTSFSQEWGIGWVTSHPTFYTVNYTITPDLFSEIVGDWACGDVTVNLEVIGQPPVDPFHAVCVADGDTFSDLITGFLTVSTPTSVGASNGGILKLTVSVNAEAFKGEAQVLPVVPVPGAVVLGSLGACLLGWYRRRHSL